MSGPGEAIRPRWSLAELIEPAAAVRQRLVTHPPPRGIVIAISVSATTRTEQAGASALALRPARE